MIKEVKTPKEFDDACKEYYKYHLNRWSISENERDTDFLIEGISFMITTPEQFKDEEIRKMFGSNVCILDESLPLLGKVCIDDTCTNPFKRGTFIGIEITEEDFYYVLQKKDGSKIYNTCVGKIIECTDEH